jgi:hypothetical protein
MSATVKATTDASGSFFTALPDDLLQRVLVGVPLDDHRVAASVCQAFRGVITGSRFPALRQKYGFAERGVVTVRVTEGDVLEIVTADKSCVLASIPGSGLYSSRGTTDGGTRLFLVSRNKNASNLLAVDVSSRRWRRLATMPQPQGYSEQCIEWHSGLLYVAGGLGPDNSEPSFLRAFNETTGLWEELPPMPQNSPWAASGIIGNQLFIAGGDDATDQGSPTLQIYDIATRTWRFGASLPDSRTRFARGFVVDGKLCVMSPLARDGNPVLVYDPQSDFWTEEAPVPLLPTRLECVHDGRLIVYQENGTVIARATDGSWRWFPYARTEPQRRWFYKSVSGSVLLG